MLITARFFSPTLRTVLAVCALSTVLTACGGTRWGFPYKTDVQQGNWITSEQVDQLRQGMTRDQVRFLLGTPTLQDVFRPDRWDYPYFNKPGYGAEQSRKFTVWFENDLLVRWAGDTQPDRQPFQRADTGGTIDRPAEPYATGDEQVAGEDLGKVDGIEIRAVDPDAALPMPGQPIVEPLN